MVCRVTRTLRQDMEIKDGTFQGSLECCRNGLIAGHLRDGSSPQSRASIAKILFPRGPAFRDPKALALQGCTFEGSDRGQPPRVGTGEIRPRYRGKRISDFAPKQPLNPAEHPPDPVSNNLTILQPYNPEKIPELYW